MSLRYSNPTTSRDAALDNLPRAGTQKARILDAISSTEDYGCLREDLERPLGLSGNTIRPRVAELIEAGLVEETERQRRTRSGSMALVLVAITNVGSSTEGPGRVSGISRSGSASQSAIGVASGVEASSPPPPSPGGLAPPESLFSVPSAYNPWEDAA